MTGAPGASAADEPVLVTGASGFVGRHVVAQLEAECRRVVPIPHAWDRASDLDAVVRDRVFGSCIHLGWYAHPADYLTNVAGNERSLRSSIELATWLVRRGVTRLVVAGTCAEYGDKITPHREDEAPDPWSVYGATKASLRLLLQSSMFSDALSVSWGRIFNVTGPGESAQRLLPFVARSLLAGEPVDLSPGQQLRDYLDVSDVARALVALEGSAALGPFNICSGDGRPLAEFITGLAARFDASELLRFGARPHGEHDPAAVVGCPGRIRTEVGWRHRCDVDELLDRVAAYWSKEGKRT